LFGGKSTHWFLEELEHAVRRVVRKILWRDRAMVPRPDGYDMAAPSGEGAARRNAPGHGDRQARDDLAQPPMAHRHRKLVELKETGAIRVKCSAIKFFNSSTKSLTGHSLGATGNQEAIDTSPHDEG
jgi:3-oxoacyl-[acyl-carrier-protein] synthase-1